MTAAEKALTIEKCEKLLLTYRSGGLGNTVMPEDASPKFSDSEHEQRLVYFTLPMALNYQRNSYTLWKSALVSWNDPATHDVFSVTASAAMPVEELRSKLLKHKVALQPNKHVATWRTLAETIASNWGSVHELLNVADHDYIELRDIIQGSHKKQFPYLSGPKIFNYWSFIISTYGGANLKHREDIEIAPDTHVTKCSILLGVISEEEALKLTRDQISARWRELLSGTGIAPIDMHPPLWFWSKNNFLYSLS